MRLSHCHNFHDFRQLARQRLPGPIFDYIDGGADDEVTHRRNTASFERCDLVPNILRGVASVDLSVTVMNQRLAVPFYCSPTALQRLFHYQGERAVAAAAAKFGTMAGVSSLATVMGDGPAYFVLADHRPEVCRPKTPLSYSGYKVWKVAAGGTFDLARRPAGGYYAVDVDRGVLAADPY